MSAGIARYMQAIALLMALAATYSPSLYASNYTLYVKSGQLTVNGAGGAVLDVWGYTDASGASPAIPGPIIEAVEGQTVTVQVINNHNRNHNFVIQGVTSDTTAIPPGGSRAYTFTTPKAGVFFYRDTLDVVNRAMGMYGALIVRPADGSKRAWSNGPSYNLERLWVVSDMDKPRWNDVARSGGTVNKSVYRPNYFLMNGQGGFDGMHDPNSVLEGNVGQTGIVRIVNAGQFDQSLHFHGNHFQVIDVNGTRLSKPEWQDTINVKAGTTAMLLYRFDQPGVFPMHIHTAQMETANGVYLNGVATMLIGK